MSGRYVHNGQFSSRRSDFDLGLTVQRYLHDAGNLTGHAGRFRHWLDPCVEAPHFDRWTYFKGGYENVYMNFDGTVRRSQGYSTTIVFDRAIEYLGDFEGRGDARPFYLHLAPVAPPRPLDRRAPVRDRHRPRPPARPLLPGGRPGRQAVVRPQPEPDGVGRPGDPDGHDPDLYTIDDQVDRLMRHLQSTGELANTLVFFTSDNGYLLGEHRATSKFLPYRKAVEVPFLVRWPGRVPAGAVDDRLVTTSTSSPRSWPPPASARPTPPWTAVTSSRATRAGRR